MSSPAKAHRVVLMFKARHPLAEARLRAEFKRPGLYGSITSWMKFVEIDGDILVDSPGLPEPIVLKAGSKQWTWESAISDEIADIPVV